MGRIRYTQRSKKVQRETRRSLSSYYRNSNWDSTCRLERLSEIEAFQVLKARLSIQRLGFDSIGHHSTEKV